MRVVLFDNYDSYLALAVSSAHELVKSLCRDDFHEIIDDIAVYLSTRDSRQIIEEERYYKDQFLLLNYNLPKWFQEDSHIEKLEKYKSPTKFSAKLTKSSTGFLDSFSGINRDKIFSLQYLFHEGGIEEIWPTWSKV